MVKVLNLLSKKIPYKPILTFSLQGLSQVQPGAQVQVDCQDACPEGGEGLGVSSLLQEEREHNTSLLPKIFPSAPLRCSVINANTQYWRGSFKLFFKTKIALSVFF